MTNILKAFVLVASMAIAIPAEALPVGPSAPETVTENPLLVEVATRRELRNARAYCRRLYGRNYSRVTVTRRGRIDCRFFPVSVNKQARDICRARGQRVVRVTGVSKRRGYRTVSVLCRRR